MVGVWVIVTVLLKVLLIPTYYSTDFEVHRNWLSITNGVPLSEWYYESTSSYHTLDYPPFFAYFQYVLAKIYYFIIPFFEKWTGRNDLGKLLLEIRPNDVDLVQHQGYPLVLIAMHRASVILTDIIYFIGLYIIFRKYLKSHAIWIPLCIPGLFLIDHIHFQYNGFLMGLLVLTLYAIMRGKVYLGTALFSSLLMFKHLYIYMLPGLACYLMFNFVRERQIWHFKRALYLTIIGLVILLVAILPFLIAIPSHLEGESMGTCIISNFKQLKARMFPFERGLTHAYWAPNFWALYNFADKILSVILNKKSRGLTGGLVGLDQGGHVVLPTIKPWMTLILSFLLSIGGSVFFCHKNEVETYKKRKKTQIQLLLECVVYSSFIFFMFGWHVHEKAILMILVPLALLMMFKSRYQTNYLFLSWIGTYSIFPLLFPPELFLVKWSIALLYHTYLALTLSSMDTMFLFAIGISILIDAYTVIVHPLLLGDRLPFLPLMITSVFCSIGVHYGFFVFLQRVFKHKSDNKHVKIQ